MEYILGVVVSLLVQWLKFKFDTRGLTTKVILLLVALASAAVYTQLMKLGLWAPVAQILMTAGAFYAFVITAFEKPRDPQA